jgi:hypothetical protein
MKRNKMFDVTIRVEIPTEEVKYSTFPAPKDGCSLALSADNISHGCGGAAIAITQDYTDDPLKAMESKTCIFGCTVSKDKLKEIIDSLTVIYENIGF